MKIDKYDFGKIIIDNKEFNNDIIIDKEIKKWWREQSHNVVLNDIKEFIKEKPKTVIFGTGYDGIMEVSDEVINFLKKNNIRVIIEKTSSAVDIFNNTQNAIAFFHLTC